MATFGLSEIQAQAILDMRLQRLTGLEREKILAEYEELIRRSPRSRDPREPADGPGHHRGRARGDQKQFGDERRTEIVESTARFDSRT